MRLYIVLVLCAVAVSALPARDENSQRIVGGSVTTINNYPSMGAFLQNIGGNFRQVCGSSILNQRAILTAAHCFDALVPSLYRVRVGSTWANSGGITHNIVRLILHPNYSIFTLDSDIAIMHTASTITYSNVVQRASIAGRNYVVPDNASVWAAGWGAIADGGQWSEQLRQVQMWNINAARCRSFYPTIFTNNMLCAGRLNTGGPAQCTGDSGGPLYHQGIVVGVCSFSGRCGGANTPSVNVKVSQFTAWIQANA